MGSPRGFPGFIISNLCRPMRFIRGSRPHCGAASMRSPQFKSSFIVVDLGQSPELFLRHSPTFWSTTRRFHEPATTEGRSPEATATLGPGQLALLVQDMRGRAVAGTLPSREGWSPIPGQRCQRKGTRLAPRALQVQSPLRGVLFTYCVPSTSGGGHCVRSTQEKGLACPDDAALPAS